MSHHEVTSKVRRGEWHRLRRGLFCTSRAWEVADRRERYLLVAVAAVRATTAAHLSHLSAAAIWGWPLPLEPTPGRAAQGAEDPLTTAWLTCPPKTGAITEGRRGLRTAVAPLLDQDVVVGERWSVTSPARTVADCLRRLPRADAVAIADAAAREGLARHEVLAVLTRQRGWLGAPEAVARLGLVDPRRESWLESWSVCRLAGRGVPLPEAQAVVFAPSGNFLGRVDWWWPDVGVVGEADGREKYRRSGLRTPGDVDRLMRQEKDREDALRDCGLQVVRYGTADAVELDALTKRIWRAFSRGDSSAVSARVRVRGRPGGW